MNFLTSELFLYLLNAQNTRNMKNLLISLVVFCHSTVSFSQIRDLDSLKYFIGQQVTVCSQVSDTYVSKTDSATTFLNFGGVYPNTKMAAVIFKKDIQNFHDKPNEYFKSKNVCLKGELVMYKEKPEIVLKRGEQIWLE